MIRRQTTILDDKKQIDKSVDNVINFQKMVAWQKQIIMDPSLDAAILNMNQQLLEKIDHFEKIDPRVLEGVDL